MARIQEHKFVDLSKPTERTHDEQTRRSFLRKAGGIAALTAVVGVGLEVHAAGAALGRAAAAVERAQ